MKRIISYLLLAFVVAACQEDAPTVPTVDGPQFAKPDCTENPDHPSCNDGDGGEYTAIDLGGLYVKGSSLAHDVNEPLPGEPLLVVGRASTRSGTDRAVLWTGAVSDIGNVDPVDLGPSWHAGDAIALGISDDGSMIVGDVGSETEDEPKPVVFRGGDQWVDGQQLELPTDCAHHGTARDVNNDGLIVGRCYETADSPWQPVVWEPGQAGQLLPSLGSPGWASGLNNDGWIVGSIGEAGGFRQAVLWRPPYGPTDVCNLHPGEWGSSSSTAWRMTDLSGSTFLVAGARDPESTTSQAAVWEVSVTETGCSSNVIAMLGSDTWALDVTGDIGDWQAAGRDFSDGRPITWTGSGADEYEFLHDGSGNAFVINSARQIVGWRRHRRNNVAVLWTK